MSVESVFFITFIVTPATQAVWYKHSYVPLKILLYVRIRKGAVNSALSLVSVFISVVWGGVWSKILFPSSRTSVFVCFFNFHHFLIFRAR